MMMSKSFTPLPLRESVTSPCGEGRNGPFPSGREISETALCLPAAVSSGHRLLPAVADGIFHSVGFAVLEFLAFAFVPVFHRAMISHDSAVDFCFCSALCHFLFLRFDDLI